MSYHGRSTGRLQDFLSEMCGVRYGHECIFQEAPKDGKPGLITFFGQPLATYTWKDDTDIPVFEFQGKYEDFNTNTRATHDECVSRFGWWKLEPDDEYEGTMGLFAEAQHGRYATDSEKQRIEDECVKARARRDRDKNFGEHLRKQIEASHAKEINEQDS